MRNTKLSSQNLEIAILQKFQKLINVSFAFQMAKIIGKGKIAKKAFIAHKAAALFRKRGYSNASMRELADSLHIEASSLYNHFASKGEILEHICDSVASGFMCHIEKVEQSKVSETEKIESIIRYHIKEMIKNYNRQCVANHDWKYLTGGSFLNHRAQRNLYETKLIALITKGIKSKAFVKRNPQVVTLTLLAAVRGLEVWQPKKGKMNSSTIEKDITQLLLKGLIN
ncbi:MAG: TetR family transcriptional regulator [Ferruginibacter sp.]|nr:TetR family transcriptional regulator [Ferruginibacter sp.]